MGFELTAKIIDDKQERMCELCECHIIEHSSSSTNYQCEGRYCDEIDGEAIKLLREELIYEKTKELETRIDLIKMILGDR